MKPGDAEKMPGAEILARDGFAVLPVEPMGKRPILANWTVEASSDPEQIERWRREFGRSNVGVATGAKSQIIVLDVDPRHGGNESLAALEAEIGPLPTTVSVSTPSGGKHFYFRFVEGVRNSAGKLGPGLDIRGEGGQVVAPPSKTAAGSYVWLNSPMHVAVAEMPAGLRAKLTARSTAAVSGKTSEGGRNTELARRVGSLLARGISPDEVRKRAHAINAEAFNPPLDDAEVDAVVNSITRAHERNAEATPLEAIGAILGAWDSDENKIPDVISQVREVMKRGVDVPTHAIITRNLTERFGLKPKQLDLPPPRDPARDARRNDPTFVDPNAPLDLAKMYLEETKDAEGCSDLVFWQDDFWTARGTCYEVVPPVEMDKRLYPWLSSKRDITRGDALKPDNTQVAKVLHAMAATALRSETVAPFWMGAPGPKKLIAFSNGFLDLGKRELIKPTRRLFATNALPYPYDETAPEPVQWFQFLNQLFGSDTEAKETLQEFAGLALTSDTSFQKILMIIGPRRSGKGTFARVLEAMVGDANKCNPTLTNLGSHFGLESLVGKTLAVISDARLSHKVDTAAIVENLLRISGEDAISVPRKHRQDWTAKLSARFLILSNEIPGFFDQSGALMGRFVILRLTRSFFDKEEKDLTDRLLTELPGILVWALHGLDRLLARGRFKQPSSGVDTLRDMEEIASPIKAFVEDVCTVDPSARIKCTDLYSVWRLWAADQGRDRVTTVQIFGRDLKAAFPDLTISRSYGGRFYEGIKIRTDRQNSPEKHSGI